MCVSQWLLIHPCKSLFDQLVHSSVKSIALGECRVGLAKFVEGHPALILFGELQNQHIVGTEFDWHGTYHSFVTCLNDFEIGSELIQTFYCFP